MANITETVKKTREYQFQFLPLEGPLPGKYFEQQTEDAINDLGEYIIRVEETSNNAYTVAVAADKKADLAQQTADKAQTTADNAQATADTALQRAGEAQESANDAMTAAQAAQRTADTAVTNAAAAQRTADTAVTNAAAAQRTADTAVTNAAAAQSTADEALQAANTSQSGASNAQATADLALTNAAKAQTAANAAQSTADAANEKAAANMDTLDRLKMYERVETAVDLNAYNEDFGRYFIANTTSTNLPANVSGWLDVDVESEDAYVRQTFTVNGSQIVYMRVGTIADDNTVTWGAWVQQALQSALASHINNKSNPHNVTAAQLGLASAYKYKGSVTNYSNLPTNAAAGDVYNVENADEAHGIKAGDNVAWTGTAWDALAGTFDTSELEAGIEQAQQTANNALPKTGGTVTGTVTFNVSPKVPTADNTSDDTTAASTAFVKKVLEQMTGQYFNPNGFYRGKDLGVTLASEADTAAFLDEHKVSEGIFTDLYVGDYFTIQDGVYNQKWLIAGFDTEYRKGDVTILQKHHLSLLPRYALLGAPMNDTNTTAGGYQGSKMFTETIPAIVANLENALGTHLLEREVLLTDSVNTTAASAAGSNWTGSSNNWSWVLQKATLMSEVQVYGSTVFSSSGYDTGEARSQLPVFRFADPILIQRFGTWLRCVASGVDFCYADGLGRADTGSASDAGNGVRPLICVG